MLSEAVIPEVAMELVSTRGRRKIRWVRSRRRRPPRGASEPVLKSGRGGDSAPWTVAFEHVEQIRLTLAAPLRAHAEVVADAEVRGCAG